VDLRSLPIPVRLVLAVSVPALALLVLVGFQVREQGERADAATEELSRTDALETLTAVQTANVLPELATLRQRVDRSGGGSFLTDLLIDSMWQQLVAEYVAADESRSELSSEAARFVGPEATAAFEAQRGAVGALVTAIGDGQGLTDDLIAAATDTRNDADLALARIAADSTSSAWIIYVGAIDAGRSVVAEYAYVSATLIGLDVADEDRLAEFGGIRTNATERVVMGLDPDLQQQVEAVLDSDELAEWETAVTAARAVAGGRADPWSILDVGMLTEPAFALQREILVITDEAVDRVRSGLLETQADAVGQRRTLLILTGLLLAVTVILTVLILRSVLSPLRKLSRRVADLAEGRIDGPRIDHGRKDSLAQLGDTIEDVADGLRHLGQQFEAMVEGDLDAASLATPAPGLVGQFVQDWVQEVREASGNLKAEATLDELTGLLNRRGLSDQLGRMAGGPEIGVVYIDLDKFKAVNDVYGHRHGDAVLKVVARRLMGFVRDDDPVCRLGGDEFVLLVTGVTREDMPIFISRLELGLSEPISFEGTVHQVGCSIGVGWLGPGDLLEPVLEEADKRMLKAKADNPDRIPR
jgi:diguanylate cyclase (GGDEF)-like protein